MQSRTPPRFVPTLTEVVPGQAAAGAGAAAAAPLSEDQLVGRVMQRVNMNLERRLRETIATTVLEQTRALGPLLREQIESVVRETVAQALADEASSMQADPRPRP